MSLTVPVSEIVRTSHSPLLGIHSSWERVHLGDIAFVLNGYAFPSAGFTSSQGMPLIRIRDILTSDTEACFAGEYDTAYLVQPGELLIGMDGDFNCALWKGPAGLLNQRVCKVTANPSFYDSHFLSHVLPGYLKAINKVTSSVTVKHLSSKSIENIPLPLPPLAEQRRIVEAIEQQFTRLDAGVAALKRTQAALKRYCAALLKAAVEGKLTTAWRAEHPNIEPASELLQHILAERRAKWEADVRAKGKEPAKVRYAEPEVLDTENLPELPEGWCWASMSALTSRIGDVDHKMPKPVNSGIPYISTKDFIGDSQIDFDGAKLISQEDFDALARKIRPQEGDILLSRYGTIGAVRRVITTIDFQASYSIAIIKPLLASQTREYLTLALRSDVVQAQMRRDIRASSQPDLGLEYIRQFAIPLPPLAEQEQIVAEVEQRLSIVNELEATVETNLKRTERLRQSILERAFAGKLVPQCPEDEPASVLLERIRSEREKPGPNGRTSHRELPITLPATPATLWGEE